MKRTIRVDGIAAMFPEEGNEHFSYVDDGVAQIVARLRDLGLEPWTSCSGLARDHAPDDPASWRAYFGVRKPSLMLSEAALLAGFHHQEDIYPGGALYYAWKFIDFGARAVAPKHLDIELVLEAKWQSLATLIGAHKATPRRQG